MRRNQAEKATGAWARRAARGGAAATVLLLAACGSGNDDGDHGGSGGGGGGGGTGGGQANAKPAYIGEVRVQTYDGVADDLLTAGLGKDGLGSATPPLPADPAAPTAAELRRYAIHSNYRALVDTSASGGYGSLYGPNVDARGNITGGQGKVAGVEYLAYSDDGTGRQNVTMMVQIPSTFDPARACLITATSSGSRGVYGGISTGEWGLKRGCAVAYTDKGTGGAPHDLETDTVPLIDGTRANRQAAGAAAQFVAPPGGTTLADFNAAAPHRLAFKHAHSQRNPEKDWGLFTLQSVEFAIWAINDRYGAQAADGTRQRTLDKDRIMVIASSISNGGGAAVAAAEQDGDGLIDGVAVTEPNLNLPSNAGVTVQRGGAAVSRSGRTLFDYTSLANMLQLCASRDPAHADAAGLGFYTLLGLDAAAEGRCRALAEAGIVTGGNLGQWAASALQQLRAYGWEAESDALHASMAVFEVSNAIAVTYANALSRASVTERLCGFSFAATGTALGPVTMPAAPLATMFSTGNGIPPNSGVQLVNDLDPRGPRRDVLSRSPQLAYDDANLAGARCLRELLTAGTPAGVRLRTGEAETLRSGNLRGKPALIVHGRSDALLPVNHTSRPYLGYNRLKEGAASRLSYVEVTNAQHFDGFIGVVPGYDNRYIPLHLYLNRALDAMFDHLGGGAPLPPSQVVRTVPRGGTLNTPAPAILPANVPPIATSPAAGDRIVAEADGIVRVPD